MAAEVRLPWRVRFHLWRTGHELAVVNSGITVPMWDISAKGVLIVCKCGTGWAL